MAREQDTTIVGCSSGLLAAQPENSSWTWWLRKVTGPLEVEIQQKGPIPNVFVLVALAELVLPDCFLLLQALSR